jgi:hypothetical protein
VFSARLSKGLCESARLILTAAGHGSSAPILRTAVLHDASSNLSAPHVT